MWRVKDFDKDCREGNYIVKVMVDTNLPDVIVYDNRTGTEEEYYRVYTKPILKIRENKSEHYYELYI